MSDYPYSYFGSTDLTSDVAACVSVLNHWGDRISISAGGDLSISICGLSSASARDFARLLVEAADHVDAKAVQP